MILAALSNEILAMLSDLYFHQFVCEIWKVIDEETASLGLVYYNVSFFLCLSVHRSYWSICIAYFEACCIMKPEWENISLRSRVT